MVYYCVHTTFFAVHCLSSIGFKTGRDAAVAPVGKEADTKEQSSSSVWYEFVKGRSIALFGAESLTHIAVDGGEDLHVIL